MVQPRGENEENCRSERKAHFSEDRPDGYLVEISQVSPGLTSPNPLMKKQVIIPMVTENSIQNNSSNLQNYKIECPKEGKFGGRGQN